jgi:sugar lactone lactonase YvrE
VTDRAGVPMVFCTNAAIASDGTVWFSDSSTQFGIDKWRHDFLQKTRTGRLLLLGETGEVEVVLDGLAFANGVALALDESYVAVAESGARTVVRWWLTGPRGGERDGRVWLGSLHDPAVAVVDLWGHRCARQRIGPRHPSYG